MDAYNYLLDHDIKPSIQRIAIMEYLMEHRTHPTVEEVYQGLIDKMPTLSKTTVYNTLKLFASQEAALMLTIDEKTIHFDSDLSPHAHFICKACGCIMDMPIPEPLANLERTTIDGNEIQETHYYYKGLCKKCLQNKID